MDENYKAAHVVALQEGGQVSANKCPRCGADPEPSNGDWKEWSCLSWKAPEGRFVEGSHCTETQLAQARERIRELEDAQRLRKFPEEKPERGQHVLAFTTTCVGWDVCCLQPNHFRSTGNAYGFELVTHWLPLPPEPKE